MRFVLVALNDFLRVERDAVHRDLVADESGLRDVVHHGFARVAAHEAEHEEAVVMTGEEQAPGSCS